MAYSPNNRFIVSTDIAGLIWFYDAVTQKTVGKPLSDHTTCIMSIEFSLDGSHLVSASLDRSARVWDVTAGKQVGEPLWHDGVVKTAVFSPNGHRIVTGSNDSKIYIWERQEA